MTLGKRLMSLAVIVLAFLGLWTHGPEFFEHGKHAVEALCAGDLAKLPKEIVDFGPVVVAGYLGHLFDTYHHVMHAVSHTQADVVALFAEHGTAKVLVGCGLGLAWVGALAFFGVAWWPLVSQASTLAGKAAWTASFMLMFGGCIELSHRWRKWKPKAPSAP